MGPTEVDSDIIDDAGRSPLRLLSVSPGEPSCLPEDARPRFVCRTQDARTPSSTSPHKDGWGASVCARYPVPLYLEYGSTMLIRLRDVCARWNREPLLNLVHRVRLASDLGTVGGAGGYALHIDGFACRAGGTCKAVAHHSAVPILKNQSGHTQPGSTNTSPHLPSPPRTDTNISL